MKRVIRFSKARYYFFGFSALLILIGVGGFVVNHGFNLGVDFQAGIAYQFQIAPPSFTVEYTGADKVQISIPAGEQALTSQGDIIFTVTNATNGSKTSFPFTYKSYATVRELADAIAAQVAGVAVNVTGDATAKPTDLIPLPQAEDITGVAVTINLSPAASGKTVATLSDVRSTLSVLGADYTIQAVGTEANQEFLVRIPVAAKVDESQFQTDTANTLKKAVEGKYGAGYFVKKSTEFVGARMAQSLASQTIWLVIIAIALILLYMIIRFHPYVFAVAAVIGVVHDALIMLSFDAVFKIQIDAGTIAAILTVLGYSINDTIVNFDRARENIGLMRGENLRTILDTSLTQTLSRTFITSGATMLTVVALYVLTSGTIKNFALNMIIGVGEGTYSTFISAFIVVAWVNASDRRRKTGELKKYGISNVERPLDAEEAVAEDAEAETGIQTAGLGVSAAEGTAAGPALVAETAGEAADANAQPTAQAPRPANVVAFPGQSGSRKNKKHKRRHH
jgi:preprotein translocase subunit SecF